MTSPVQAAPCPGNFELLRFESERHLATHRQVIADCFACTPEDGERWLGVAGEEKVRVLECNEEYRATALLMPMAQYFGGRAVPMRGVAGVATPVEFRRSGVARVLMAECLREMHDAGDPISTLYASTSRLYRSVGYEMAGYQPEFILGPEHLPKCQTALEIRKLTEADRPAMQEITRQNAAVNPGHLDRCDYIWPRLLNPRGKPTQQYGFFDDEGGMRGFIAFKLDVPDDLDSWQGMEVTVAEVADEDGLDALVSFLRSYHSMVRRIETHLPPQHPIHSHLPEQRGRMRLYEQFLVRIVNVEKALEARGYPISMFGSLDFHLDDPILTENSGRWRLSVADGRGQVERLDDGNASAQGDDLVLDIGALAPLFTGHQPAEHLATLGRARAQAETLALASSIFAGRAPTCPEMF